MTDLDVLNRDLVYKDGDFQLASVPRAMPLVLELTTKPQTWTLDPFFGVNLGLIRESSTVEDIGLTLVRFVGVEVLSFTPRGNSASLQLSIGKEVVNVNI